MSGSSKASGLGHLKRLRLRWPVVLCVFAGLFTCVVAIVLWMPDKYESRLKIVVKSDHGDPSNKQTQGTLRATDAADSQVNTEIQLLTGSKVLGEVVKARHLDDLVAMEGPPEARIQAALRQLQKEIVVAPIRNSNVIVISYESTDAKRSTEVLNTLWQSYNLVNRRMHGAPGSLGYYERLSGEYDDQLAQAQAELSKFRTEHDISSLTTEQEHSPSSARYRQETDQAPRYSDRDRRVPNQALTQKLTSLLETLEHKRTEWALLYKPNDPLLTKLDAEIERTKAALAESKSSPDENSIAANPSSDNTRGEYMPISAIRADKRADDLARQLNNDTAGLPALTADSWEYKQLVRKVSELEELDLSYHKKVQQASLDQTADQQPTSNLAIVDEPFTPTTPSSPHRGLLLSLGFLCSALLALISGSIAEIADFRFGPKPSPRATVSGSRRTSSRSGSTTKAPQSATQSARPTSHRSPGPTIVMPAQERQPFAAQTHADDLDEIADAEFEEITAPPEPMQLVLENGDHDHVALAAEQFAVVPVARADMQAPHRPAPEPLPLSVPIFSTAELGQTTGLPLLATVSAASFPPVSSKFTALYLSVQRGEIAYNMGVQ